jgi:hypothetical protein
VLGPRSGVTAAAVARHPVERDVLEIEPAVSGVALLRREQGGLARGSASDRDR